MLVHTGPFGNIATGNSSVVADLIGIHAGDYLVTEAGFGADMGAERFFNIKCRASGLQPDAAVVVATVRALKAHSGKYKIVAGKPLPEDLLAENPDDVLGGRGQPAQADRERAAARRARRWWPSTRSRPTTLRARRDPRGRRGGRAPGPRCARTSPTAAAARPSWPRRSPRRADEPSDFRFLYPDEASLREKIETVATRVYGADGVEYSPQASRQLDTYEKAGFGTLPVCIAKTHLSISSDPSLKGAPTGWTLPVREVRASVGAGFVYPICGEMRTMPGLGTNPAAARIDLDENGEIVGLS